jgi:CheY-like chemotaxis protein
MATLERHDLSQQDASAAPEVQASEDVPRSEFFRAVNDKLIHLYAEAEHEFGLIVCECNRSGCAEPLEVTLEEYEAARASSSCFLLAPGHESVRGHLTLLRTERFVLAEERPALRAVQANGREAADERSPRVLIVESDASVRRLCSRALATAALEVLVAPGGRAGLARARFEPPDLIVADVRMPGFDGFELAQALQSDERTREIPVLFMGDETELEDRARAYALGAAGYATKPLDAPAFASLVTVVLSRRRYAGDRESAGTTPELSLVP